MLFRASSFASWRHCRNRKLSAQSFPKTRFFEVFGVRGVPPREKRSLRKTAGSHQDEKSRFWCHSGVPWGVPGSPVLTPGPPSGATLHVPGPEKTVWEGVWKTRQKNDANIAHKRGGTVSYESVGKNHNGLHREKDVFLEGLGDPKMMQKGPRERHYTHHGGSKVPFVASVRRLLRVPFFNDFFVRFSSTFGVRPGIRKWSRRHARAALAPSIIIFLFAFFGAAVWVLATFSISELLCPLKSTH